VTALRTHTQRRGRAAPGRQHGHARDCTVEMQLGRRTTERVMASGWRSIAWKKKEHGVARVADDRDKLGGAGAGEVLCCCCLQRA
jgi:hypothetical protein